MEQTVLFAGRRVRELEKYFEKHQNIKKKKTNPLKVAGGWVAGGE